MSEPISIVLDLTAHKGKLPELKTLVSTLANDVKSNEHGTLAWECFADDANNRLCFRDQYASSEALLQHLSRGPINQAMNTLMSNCDVNNLTVLGNCTPQAKEVLGPLGATYVTPFAGFNRTPIHATH